MFSKEQLKSQLEQMGITHQDTVLIHTSFKAVGPVEDGPEGFLDMFCEYLDRGLFLVPTHTWANVNREQPVYDVRSTEPCIGLIPRTAAVRTDGIRSLHPTHSIWAHGAQAEAFVAGEDQVESPAPAGSCWNRLPELGTKILLIGVPNSNNTFIHAVDEMADLPGRLVEDPWDVTIVDRDGNRITHPFRSHSKNTGSGNFCNFEEPLVVLGAQQFGTLGNAQVRVVDAAKCRDVILKIYSRTREHLCLTRRPVPEELWR